MIPLNQPVCDSFDEVVLVMPRQSLSIVAPIMHRALINCLCDSELAIVLKYRVKAQEVVYLEPTRFTPRGNCIC